MEARKLKNVIKMEFKRREKKITNLIAVITLRIKAQPSQQQTYIHDRDEYEEYTIGIFMVAT